jgi:hypothetical protein
LHTAFGLTRDPFVPSFDGSLFWENAERMQCRLAARELLLSGAGVWLSGPPGSGRSALLARLADDVACAGRPVLAAESMPSRSPEEFLTQLLDMTTEEAGPAGLLPTAEALYVQVLEAFCSAGTVPCFPALGEPTVGVLAEAAILARFRVAGRPLVSLALMGEGDSPFAGAERVSLPAPAPSDLEACLIHRAAQCGNPNVLPPETLRAIAAGSSGFGDAIARARKALARAAFRPWEKAAQPNLREAPRETETRPNVLDPAELDELSELLESLSPSR